MVPGDFGTIQDGIDHAVDGDTVMIAPGTYHEYDINFDGKAITVTGTDPEDMNVVSSTIVDAGSLGRVFIFDSGEDTTSVLAGLSLTGGHTPDWGGAIRCYQSSPRIIDNIVIGNSSEHGGGGIFLEDSRSIISGNTITGNSAGWGGGGIRCSSAAPIISDNLIMNNTADYGGGIDCHYGAHPLIIGNLILNNSSGDGGGIYAYDYSAPAVFYTLIAGNTAEYGGGMHCRYDCTPLLIRDTFTGNTATIQGGGVRCKFSSPLVAMNTVFWDDNAPEGKEIYMGGYPSANPSVLTISYSDVEGGLESIYSEPGNDVNWGPGMLVSDPLFVRRDALDYRLLWGSPCIDAGIPDSLDVDGTRSDIGAFPFDQGEILTLYLSPDSDRVFRGGRLGVLYTVINRQQDPETFTIESSVTLPDGTDYPLLGPDQHMIQGDRTVQVQVYHDVPQVAPLGYYLYHSTTETGARMVSGSDDFLFMVTDSPH
jgi:hypothetical protein